MVCAITFKFSKYELQSLVLGHSLENRCKLLASLEERTAVFVGGRNDFPKHIRSLNTSVKRSPRRVVRDVKASSLRLKSLQFCHCFVFCLTGPLSVSISTVRFPFPLLHLFQSLQCGLCLSYLAVTFAFCNRIGRDNHFSENPLVIDLCGDGFLDFFGKYPATIAVDFRENLLVCNLMPVWE